MNALSNGKLFDIKHLLLENKKEDGIRTMFRVSNYKTICYLADLYSKYFQSSNCLVEGRQQFFFPSLIVQILLKFCKTKKSRVKISYTQ